MNNPTVQALRNFRARTTTALGGTLGLPVHFIRCSGTFEIRIVVPGDPSSFSFYVQGGYGFNMNEGQRQLFSYVQPELTRNCTIDTISSSNNLIVVNTTAPSPVRTWEFTFSSYPSILPTVEVTAGAVPPGPVTIMVTDMVDQSF